MAEFKEEDILSAGFRKKIIEEMIDDPENIDRKMKQLRKHEVLRDQNDKWVAHAIAHEEYDLRTQVQMENRISNISICRKVIEKKARTYNGGVTRLVDDAASQDSIDDLAKELDIDSAMKKTDRYRELFANCLIHPVPVKDTRESRKFGTDKFRLKIKVLSPWEYDVIEDPNDITQPGVVIVTDFPERFRANHRMHSLRGGQGFRTGHAHQHRRHDSGDQRQQTIADSPSDAGTEDDKRTFIWWSDQFHFTTNSQGVIIETPFAGDGFEAVKNPIGMLAFTNVTRDQDCHFWAQGGDDIVETSILINKILTDINYVTYLQGWGQMVISGKDLPNVIKGGPGKAIAFDVKDGDPNPQVFYATSNPPINDWLETVRSQLAMMLSTNNLSVRQIATKLDVASAASGIALIIENSEMVSTQQDIQQVFRDREPEMWEIIRRWHESFSDKNALTEAFQVIPKFKDSNVELRFNEMAPPLTEREKLEEIKLRKELKINTPIELLQKDNPHLTEDDAEKKLEELDQIKEENVAKFGPPTAPQFAKDDKDSQSAKEEEEKNETE